MEKLQENLPFVEYILSEDLTKYEFSSNILDERTGKNFIDVDKDFRVGRSGGFLMNIDFTFIDTNIFNKVGRTYTKNSNDLDVSNWVESLDVPKTENRGKFYYCPHRSSSRAYNTFWKRETSRRRNGMTAKCKMLKTGKVIDLHITGDHYNYLNYSRILRTPTEIEQAELHAKGDFKTTQIEEFPRFWDGDYWNFKIDFFIAQNNYHLAKGKARGKGYSYKRGGSASNTINLIPKATVVLAAYDLSYLTAPQATSDMVKINLDWYEDNTHWKRFYISEDLRQVELGYRTTSGGNKKFGWRSKLLSVSAFNNDSAVIGKRAIEIDLEESGKFPNIENLLGVTLSSTEVGSANIGTIRAYGTAGTKHANWQGFSNIFFHPSKSKMMPFENVWDKNARTTVCGFFHPQVWNLEPFMDINGNSQLLQAQQYDSKDKKIRQQELPLADYIIYVGQRANSPSEAFKTGGLNIFTSAELSDHYSRLVNGTSMGYYRDGALVEDKEKGLTFKTNNQLTNEGLNSLVHDYIMDVPFNPAKDFQGCIREYHPPYKDEHGNTPTELYYASIDQIGKDKNTSLVTKQNSLISIQVFMYPNNYSNTSGDILVAAWAGRPSRAEEGDRKFLQMLDYYNAKGIVEVDRGNTVNNFRQWRKLHKLYKDPTVILTTRQEISENANYGINIGSGSNKEDGLIYLRDWLYTKRAVDEMGNPIYTFHYINDIPFITELITYDLMGNFDRISSALPAMFQLNAKKVQRKSEVLGKRGKSVSIYEQIGMYGYKDR